MVKVAIEVKNREEGNLIKAALLDPTTRAMVLIMGALSELPTNAEKLSVLRFVEAKFANNCGEGESPCHPPKGD